MERLKTALESGSSGAVDVAAQEVDLMRRAHGTLDITPLVEALSLWAREQGGKGRPDRGLAAVQLLERRWAPNHPTVLGTRVILLRQQGIGGYISSLPEVLELTRIRLLHPEQRWLWIVQHVSWLRLMATLLLWAWALTMALRYRRVFRYAWEEPLERRGVGGLPLALIGAVLVSLPVLVGLDPAVAAMLWICLLAPYLNVREVKLTYLVIFFQFAHPVLTLLEPAALQPPPPSLVAFQLQPQSKPLQNGQFKAFTLQDQAFLKGWREFQAQDWKAAEATFEGLLGRHSDQGEVLNNLGAARFHLGKTAEAAKEFEAANLAKPGSCQVLLNQSVLAFQSLDTATGIAKQEEARVAAPELYEVLKSASQARNEAWAFAMPLPDTPQRVEALKSARPAPSSETLGSRSISVAAGFLFPLLMLALFMFRLWRSVKRPYPTQCARCGETFHTTDSPLADICSKCHHLFVLKQGLHGGKRKLKLEEVAFFQSSKRWIHRILLVLLPGADLCFLGETSRGFIELLSVCFAAGLVLGVGRSPRYPGEILPDPTSLWLPLGSVLLAVLFLRSWLKLLPRGGRS
ncbi:MAG: hypothetical protein LWX11_02940 [Firmicutes bacterium]|nr:hypothetical protein [Bacillota bacterium]